MEPNKTARELETELDRSEAITAFTAKVVEAINQFDCDLDYRPADLAEFVSGCWPCDGSPADVAANFAAAAEHELVLV